MKGVELYRQVRHAVRIEGLRRNPAAGRFCHSRTSSITASVTRLIRSGLTASPQLLEMALDLPHRHAAGEPRSVRNLNHLIGVGIVDTPSCKVTAKNALNQQGIPECLFLL